MQLTEWPQHGWTAGAPRGRAGGSRRARPGSACSAGGPVGVWRACAAFGHFSWCWCRVCRCCPVDSVVSHGGPSDLLVRRHSGTPPTRCPCPASFRVTGPPILAEISEVLVKKVGAVLLRRADVSWIAPLTCTGLQSPQVEAVLEQLARTQDDSAPAAADAAPRAPADDGSTVEMAGLVRRTPSPTPTCVLCASFHWRLVGPRVVHSD